MSKYRIENLNKLRTDRNTLIKAQERDEEILRGLGKLTLPGEILREKKAQLSDSIATRKIQIDNLNKREKAIQDGELDNEFEKQAAQSKIEQKKKNVQFSIQKKENRAKETGRIAKTLKRDRTHRFEEKQEVRDWRYYEKVFGRAIDSFPDYMTKNLENMPENKGYIWKGCWFFGLQPVGYNDKRRRNNYNREEPLIMFEKLRNGATYIHEINKTSHVVYTRDKQGNRKMIRTTARVPKKQIF
jgi:hypothetical protein